MWTLGGEKRDENSLGHQLWDAWRVTNDDNSPRTFNSQLRFLSKADAEKLHFNGIKAIYLVPSRTADDNVVDDYSAIGAYSRAYGTTNLLVKCVESNRHASPAQNHITYNETIDESINKEVSDEQKPLGTEYGILK